MCQTRPELLSALRESHLELVSTTKRALCQNIEDSPFVRPERIDAVKLSDRGKGVAN